MKFNIDSIDNIKENLRRYLEMPDIEDLDQLYSDYLKRKDDKNYAAVLRGGIGFLVFTVARNIFSIEFSDENILELPE